MNQKINIIQQDTDFLLIIDCQNDRFPGGANPVPNGNEIIEPIMRICPFFKKIMVAILAFHPSQGKNYCIIGTPGVEFPDFQSKFREDAFRVLIIRGASPDINYPFSSGKAAKIIKKYGARRVFLCGLPLDTAIKEIALIFKDQGLEVVIFEDGT